MLCSSVSKYKPDSHEKLWDLIYYRCLEGNKCNIINQNDKKKIGIVQVIFLSAMKHQATSWQLRLYEALFLIGYKKVLYDLGIDDEDAEKKFCGGAQLKGGRRVMFTLCQELEMNDQARLLQLFQVKLYLIHKCC